MAESGHPRGVRPKADLEDNLGIVAVRLSSPEDRGGPARRILIAGGYDATLGIASDALESAVVESVVSLIDLRVHLYKVQRGNDPTKLPHRRCGAAAGRRPQPQRRDLSKIS